MHESNIDSYRILRKIGRGTYGEVYLARNKNQDFVAMKKINRSHTEDGFNLLLIREINILSRLDHPNVIKLLQISGTVEWMHDGGFICCVFPFYDSDLSRQIQSKPNSKTIKEIVRSVLLGLEHIHSKSIIHRDLKPSNIFLNSGSTHAVIGDWGLAKDLRFAMKKTPHVYTDWYRAPEVFGPTPFYTQTADLWALGCIWGELLNREPLFKGTTEIHQMQLLRIPPVLRTDNQPEKELIEALLNPNPLKRPSASELLANSFFDLY